MLSTSKQTNNEESKMLLSNTLLSIGITFLTNTLKKYIWR